jgi:hypothetical protein
LRRFPHLGEHRHWFQDGFTGNDLEADERAGMDYVQCAPAVESIAANYGFCVAEAYIDQLQGDDDEKSALWLLAWSYADREEQRRVAYDALGAVSLN